MDITDLSPADLCHILWFLSGKEIAQLSQTCQYLRHVCNIESVWKHACAIEFNFTSIEDWDGTYRDVYAKVLNTFGNICGLWLADFYPYGGFILIKKEHGKLVAYELSVPGSDTTKDFDRIPLFELSLKGGNLDMKCRLSKECRDGHEGELVRSVVHCDQNMGTPVTEADGISFKCMAEGNHTRVEINNYDLHMEDVKLLKEKSFGNRFLRPLTFKRFTPCEANAELGPIIPGMYKGDYNIHGIEILHATYKNGVLSGTKITGDPNVPATKMSFVANFSRPFDPEDSPEFSFNLDSDFDEDDHQMANNDIPTGMKRFQLPLDIEEGNGNIPKYYSEMYWADGQVALVGFVSPDFIPALFVVFNQTLFGVIFWELNSFALFSRVEEASIDAN